MYLKTEIQKWVQWSTWSPVELVPVSTLHCVWWITWCSCNIVLTSRQECNTLLLCVDWEHYSIVSYVWVVMWFVWNIAMHGWLLFNNNQITTSMIDVVIWLDEGCIYYASDDPKGFIWHKWCVSLFCQIAGTLPLTWMELSWKQDELSSSPSVHSQW